MKEKLVNTLEIVRSILTNKNYYSKFSEGTISDLKKVRRIIDETLKILKLKTESALYDSDYDFSKKFESGVRDNVEAILCVLENLNQSTYLTGVNSVYSSKLRDCSQNFKDILEEYYIKSINRGFFS